MKHDSRLVRGLLKAATSEIIFKNYELIDEENFFVRVADIFPIKGKVLLLQGLYTERF